MPVFMHLLSPDTLPLGFYFLSNSYALLSHSLVLQTSVFERNSVLYENVNSEAFCWICSKVLVRYARS